MAESPHTPIIRSFNPKCDNQNHIDNLQQQEWHQEERIQKGVDLEEGRNGGRGKDLDRRDTFHGLK